MAHRAMKQNIRAGSSPVSRSFKNTSKIRLSPRNCVLSRCFLCSERLRAIANKLPEIVQDLIRKNRDQDRCFFLPIGYMGRIWYNEATKWAMIS